MRHCRHGLRLCPALCLLLGNVTPIFMDFYVGQTPQNAALSCNAVRENATSQSFFFNFSVSNGSLFANSFE